MRPVTVSLVAPWYAALLVLLGTPVPAAHADSGVDVPPVGPAFWQPPPVVPAALPSYPGPQGQPDGHFTLSGKCVTAVDDPALVDTPPAQRMLDLADAQQISTGAGVTVAVIDTGVNPHPYLRDRLTSGGDYIEPGGNALHDCDGHGTIVAGIIAADTRANGRVGFIGVAPDAHILAIRQTDGNYTDPAQNNMPAGDVGTLAKAIRYAADQDDVKVITMSLDHCELAATAPAEYSSASGEALHAAIDYAVNARDKVVVAAAGNTPDGQTADQTGASPCASAPQNDDPDPNAVRQVEIPPVYATDVLSVASVDPSTGAVSRFSEWGPWVGVAAPGEQIVSVDPSADAAGLSDTIGYGNNTESLQGTSFAAPYVAGLAALVRAEYPRLSARQVMYRIEATARHPSGPGGRNNQIGYGIIDPVAALTARLPGQNGVPAAVMTAIPAQLPADVTRNWVALRVALAGTGVAVALMLGTWFTVHTRRRGNARRNIDF